MSSTDGIGLAIVGHILVVIWRDGVIQSRFEKQRAALEETVALYPGEAGFLLVIEPSADPPDEKLRRASTELILSQGDNLKCVAGVVEGKGFRAAVTRSALSTITLVMSGRKAPLAYFANTSLAVGWMSRYVAVDSSAQLLAEVERLRGLLGPPQNARAGRR